MQHNYHSHDSGGNWIAFLFGVTFNIVTHIIDPGPASYIVHAIAGGIVCLMFKLIGDLFTPMVLRIGRRLSQWIENKIDSFN
ncbi:MAG: hypothetical protein QM762_09900 [Chryseolinea sp.]